MAKTVKSFEFKATSSFAQSKYPWNDWLNGKIWCLTQGEDFGAEVDVQGFRSSILIAATKAYKNVKVNVVKEKDMPMKIYLQAEDMTDEQKAEADAKREAAKEREKANREAKKAKKAKAQTNGTSTETPVEESVQS